MESSALVYIGLTIITVGFALCIDNKDFVAKRIRGGRLYGEYKPLENRQARNFVSEVLIYLLLTGVSACRVAVGNDYWTYRDNFALISQERFVSSEFGFNYIVKWIQLLFGYDRYKPVFAFFSILTVFFFVKALHDQARDYAFSLFLLMTGGYYFNSLNSIRYYLALAICLYAMKYLLSGRYGKFVLWILLGAVFHKTILFTIPVYLVAWYLAVKGMKKWHLAVAGAIGLSLVFLQDFYRFIIFRIYPDYENSMFDNGRVSYINILKCICVLGLCLFTYKEGLLLSCKDGRKEQERDIDKTGFVHNWTGGQALQGYNSRILANRFYFYLNLAGLCVCFCGNFIPESTRLAHYLMIGQVFLLPGVLQDMKPGVLQKLCKIAVILAFILYFGVLLYKMYDVDVRLLPYLNWIFH